MQKLSQVLGKALLILGEKYHYKQVPSQAGEGIMQGGVNAPVPSGGEADTQREVLRRFMHFPD
ncbi:MAG: hypothetical protein ICV83_13785 [Cytophagales bacterium]|nr:hypothetical protein [Cytophagales bacterium]